MDKANDEKTKCFNELVKMLEDGCSMHNITGSDKHAFYVDPNINQLFLSAKNLKQQKDPESVEAVLSALSDVENAGFDTFPFEEIRTTAKKLK